VIIWIGLIKDLELAVNLAMQMESIQTKTKQGHHYLLLAILFAAGSGLLPMNRQN